MKLSILPLVAGLATASPVLVDPLADTPSGHEVSIVGLAFAGSGCPAGTVSGQLSSDLTTITLLYANFVAQAGQGISASNYRKNCQLNVKIKYPQGYQFSVFKADYRGYAQIPAGDTGTCKATYYFSGDSKQVSQAPHALLTNEPRLMLTINTTTRRSPRPSRSRAPTTITTSRRTPLASSRPSGPPAGWRGSSTSTPRCGCRPWTRSSPPSLR